MSAAMYFFENLLDQVSILVKDFRERTLVSIHSLVRATGMSYTDLIDFLNSNDIDHIGFTTTYDAVEVLKAWYLKKMRRYVRNCLTQELEPGSTDEMLFLQFCETYRKIGHQQVTSWDDIDEFRLLQDFESSCLNEYFPIFSIEPRGADSLLNRIHRSFLFHLRLKKTPNHNDCLTRTILLIILCNRYHIFTGEANSNAVNTTITAYGPLLKLFKPPRSVATFGLASLA